MSLVEGFRIKETTTTSGTGTLNLAGAPSKYNTFVSEIGTGNTVMYWLYDGVTGDWECGIGTVTDATPDTLSRDSVIKSSNNGNKISLTAGGTHTVLNAPVPGYELTHINKLTVYDENGGAIVVDTNFNSLPVYDENGIMVLVDMVNTNLETVVTYNTYTVSHTLDLTDVSTISNGSPIVGMNVASANNLTVPPNSSVAFPIGTKIDCEQLGAGQTTIVAGSGVTVHGTPGLKFRAQYSPVTLVQKALDEWHCFGDLSS